MGKNRTFKVEAIWDEDARAFYSRSDIEGLHIEAESVEEFERIMRHEVGELIVANHLSDSELAREPISDLIPTILWRRPDALPAPA